MKALHEIGCKADGVDGTADEFLHKVERQCFFNI